MSDDQFPYEYGSDLHWLWGWGERLKQRLAGAGEPNQHDWGIFRPDRLASDAMTRFGASYPTIIGQIQDYLRFTELRFGEFQTLHPDEAASVSFARAMDSLQRRIAVAVETIAEAESNKKEAAKSDHASDGAPTAPAPSDHVCTPMQRAILDALDGRAMTKLILAGEVANGDHSRMYYTNRKEKTGGLKELMLWGKVKNKRTVGYYRPDAPPPD